MDSKDITKIFVDGQFKPDTAYQGDGGIDLKYNGSEEINLHQGTIYKIPTGTYCEIPFGKCGIIFERSGLASKHGIEILGRIIDSAYRGEIVVILGTNYHSVIDVKSNKLVSDVADLIIKPGDKIAQMVIVDCFPLFNFVNSLEELSKTERGGKGLGSSGR